MRSLTPWSVLVVPATARGRGSGHLKRSLSLVRSLRGLGKDAFLFLESADADAVPREELAERFSIEAEILFSGDPASRPWTFILLDRFRTDPAEFGYWSAIAPVVGVDEGGRRRTCFDYLIDLLPSLPSTPRPNMTAPGFLEAPARRRASFDAPRFSQSAPLRVLATFGGEDSAGMSLPAARSLASDPRVSVDLLRGALAARVEPMPGVAVLDPLPDLKERLADYDLVVTQYGLTAFEAARARVPVLLVSPTRYHEKLARAAGFVSAGVGPRAASRVRRHLDDLSVLAARTAAAIPSDSFSGDPSADVAAYAQFVSGLNFPSTGRCPLCGARDASSSRVLGRFADRTYRRCASCGMAHLIRIDDPPIVYARDYFFEDYKKQYGKTYLEDFPSLERSGRARAKRIASLLAPRGRGAGPATPPRILDIGCAYGPFLAAARSEGFASFGLDPAEDAVRFVRDELKIPAVPGLFPDTDPRAAFGIDEFDAIGMWYVIEHFPDLGEVLDASSRLLRRGGVLAFSTPSFGGVSGRVRPADFLEKSPADHFTIWEPGRTAALLRRFGFRLAKIVVTGHHPERFPLLSEVRTDGILYTKAIIASRLLGLGDTFEAYAVKETSRHE